MHCKKENIQNISSLLINFATFFPSTLRNQIWDNKLIFWIPNYIYIYNQSLNSYTVKYINSTSILGW